MQDKYGFKLNNSSFKNSKIIELSNWPRRQHFEFYSGMAEPNFSVCLNLNVANLLSYCKTAHTSFYDAYLFATMKAVNQFENFRYRLLNGNVIECSEIGINATHLLEDKTFRFTYVKHATTFNSFTRNNREAIKKASLDSFVSKEFVLNQDKLNTIYLSVLPWLNFISFRHATDPKLNNGVPKFVFGKIDKMTQIMPLSIEVNHALVDGYHVGLFVDELQHLLDDPERLLL